MDNIVQAPQEHIRSSHISIVSGSNSDDILNGTAKDDEILGYAGNDTIFGYLGDDTIIGGQGDDSLHGGLGNDILRGGFGEDLFYGNEGNDSFYATYGSDSIDGHSGLDSVIYDHAMSQHSLVNISASHWMLNEFDYTSTDYLHDVERLQFTDKAVALDINTGEVGGSCYRIYKAAFNRQPDHTGLGYWIDKMDLGMPLSEVSSRFIDSNEFKALYGDSPSNEVFLANVYSNILGRAPDEGGYKWWLDELQNNASKTWTKVLTDFSESAENQEITLALIGNGIEYDLWIV